MNRLFLRAPLALLLSIPMFVVGMTLAACDGPAAPALDVEAPALTAEAPPSLGPGPDQPIGPEHPFKLRLGTGVALAGRRYLTFDEVGPDGRCPFGHVCRHEGTVKAHVTLHTTRGPSALTLELPGGHPDALPLSEAPRASADGLLIYLVQLTPYPGGRSEARPRAAEQHPWDPLPPTATLVVTPCPGGAERCAASSIRAGDA